MKPKRVFSPERIKADFPFFRFNPKTVYLDNAATTLKPQVVLDKLMQYYQEYSANVFRGLYSLSQKATDEYEAARELVAKFINAGSSQEIIFTRGTTESLNLVASSWGGFQLQKGDEIAVLVEEHHANFVTWQQLAKNSRSRFKVIGFDQNWGSRISPKTKLLAVNYVSNVLGEIKPLKALIAQAKAQNPHLVVVVDAAQAAPLVPLDVQDLNCDFLAFSGHKLLGPTGVGVLWGKQALLEQMPPFLYGGEMIKKVTVHKTTFADLPHKFEAGTPPIAQAIGLAEAIKYLNQFNPLVLLDHEQELVKIAQQELVKNPNIRVLESGSGFPKTGIISFSHSQIHAHDLAEILGQEQVCVRAGHHCAMPLHQALGLTGTIRLSVYLYNTRADIERFLSVLKKAETIFEH